MKTIRTVLIYLLLVFSAVAAADGYPQTKTYEANVHKLRLPATATGTLAVRESDRDDFETYRVTDRTLYVVNGRTMRLEDFRVVIDNRRNEGNESVNVVRDIETNTIIKVYLSTQ